MDKYLPPDHDPSSLPPLHIFQDVAGLDTTTAKGVIQLHPGNDSVLERSKKVLEETNRIFVRTQFTRQQIEKRLEDLQQEASREYRYPYEWVLFMIPQIGVIVFLLIGHFRHDNLLWSVNNSLARHSWIGYWVRDSRPTPTHIDEEYALGPSSRRSKDAAYTFYDIGDPDSSSRTIQKTLRM